MLDCWNYEPHLRPTFTAIASSLDAMLSSVVGQVCSQLLFTLLVLMLV